MITALISALAAIVASAGAIVLTKAKEREATWRATKLTYYKEFFGAASGTIGDETPRDAKIRFATAVNNLHLIASAKVIDALHAFTSRVAMRMPRIWCRVGDDGYSIELRNLALFVAKFLWPPRSRHLFRDFSPATSRNVNGLCPPKHTPCSDAAYQVTAVTHATTVAFVAHDWSNDAKIRSHRSKR